MFSGRVEVEHWLKWINDTEYLGQKTGKTDNRRVKIICNLFIRQPVYVRGATFRQGSA